MGTILNVDNFGILNSPYILIRNEFGLILGLDTQIFLTIATKEGETECDIHI